jgi:hypothetical protein
MKERKKDDLPSQVTTEITEKGYPITKAGMDKFMHMYWEQEKRDQDVHGVYIYNDWSGWGATEVLENMVSLSPTCIDDTILTWRSI